MNNRFKKENITQIIIDQRTNMNVESKLSGDEVWYEIDTPPKNPDEVVLGDVPHIPDDSFDQMGKSSGEGANDPGIHRAAGNVTHDDGINCSSDSLRNNVKRPKM